MKKTWRDIGVVIGFSLVFFLWNQGGSIINRYVINDDAAQHTVWAYKYTGNHNFQEHDVIVETSETIQPYGIYAIHRLLSPFFEPLQYVIVMSFITLLTACFYLFFFLKKALNFRLAVIGFILLCSIILERMVGFHSRAFAFLFISAFVYYTGQGSYYAAALILFLSSLFYPSSFLLCAFTVGFYFAANYMLKNDIGIRLSHLLSGVAALGFGFIIISIHKYQIEKSALLGSFFSFDEISRKEIFTGEGRVPLMEQVQPVWSSFGELFAENLIISIISLVFISLYLYFLYKKRNAESYDLLIVSYMFSGLILYFLARLFFFQLFIPTRYLKYTFSVFMVLALLRIVFLSSIKLKKPFIFVPLLAIAIFFAAHTSRKRLVNYSKNSDIYQAINKIQKKALIAGPFGVCNQIPVFCRQSVLFSYEASHSMYFEKSYTIFHQRIKAFIKAYLANDAEVIKNFVDKYDVDIIIIDKKFFRSCSMRKSFEPYTEMIEKHCNEKQYNEFAVFDSLPAKRIPVNKRYELLHFNQK